MRSVSHHVSRRIASSPGDIPLLRGSRLSPRTETPTPNASGNRKKSSAQTTNGTSAKGKRTSPNSSCRPQLSIFASIEAVGSQQHSRRGCPERIQPLVGRHANSTRRQLTASGIPFVLWQPPLEDVTALARSPADVLHGLAFGAGPLETTQHRGRTLRQRRLPGINPADVNFVRRQHRTLRMDARPRITGLTAHRTHRPDGHGKQWLRLRICQLHQTSPERAIDAGRSHHRAGARESTASARS